jgi:hypothetical protein
MQVGEQLSVAGIGGREYSQLTHGPHYQFAHSVRKASSIPRPRPRAPDQTRRRPTGIIGLGMFSEYSRMRVPRLPQKNTTFMV